MEKPAFTRACLSDVRVIRCSCAAVKMSGDDGMDSSTQVSAVRCAWAPVAMSYHVRH
jgi:hypothetical protein